MLKSKTFKTIFRRLKEGFVRRESKEYERLLDSLVKMSGLSHEETEACIEHSRKKGLREKFQNPYLKKSSSSYGSVIEENIHQSLSFSRTLSLA